MKVVITFSSSLKKDSFYKIKHYDHEIAELGKNVTLFCNLTTPEDVLQITWQKIQDSLPQNIGTYSRKHGAKILPPYLDRLHCDVLGPKASFLTIREVTFDDEACYKCLFNMFPHGSHRAHSCLHIITLSELNIDLQSDPNSEGVLRATCSVMGKPAPQISLFPSQVLVNPPEEHRALNPEGTVTVTKVSNISLEAAASLGVHHLIVHVDHPLWTEDKVVPLAAKGECK
ncbi:OX-2 membrane glycoprotein-like [Tenrec ecaudatus]|uniref:OX-2 membrane glycoprotein-like n=1 Tax=Tenrec ecaudatus TaxID=94439 RepID=UPI003F599BE6